MRVMLPSLMPELSLSLPVHRFISRRAWHSLTTSHAFQPSFSPVETIQNGSHIDRSPRDAPHVGRPATGLTDHCHVPTFSSHPHKFPAIWYHCRRHRLRGLHVRLGITHIAQCCQPPYQGTQGSPSLPSSLQYQFVLTSCNTSKASRRCHCVRKLAWQLQYTDLYAALSLTLRVDYLTLEWRLHRSYLLSHVVTGCTRQ